MNREIQPLKTKIIETVARNVRHIQRPFGVLLSGGFDSGFLAALTEPDFFYNVRFSIGGKYDESRYAEAIIDHLDIRRKTRIITITQESFLSNLDSAIKTLGKETTHFSLTPFHILMKTIRKEHGECNVLSGEGPDEYLGGYARWIIFDQMKKLYDIPELRSYTSSISRVVGDDLVAKYGLFMNYPAQAVEKYSKLYKENQYPLLGVIGKMDMELGTIEIMEQAMARNEGIKLIYPYINRDLSEFCYQLPDDLKIRNGITKWAFREICREYLPDIMMTRDKMGGPVAPVNLWKNWMAHGEYDKTEYLNYQRKVLYG